MGILRATLLIASLGLLLFCFLGRLRKDLPHLIYTFYLLRSCFMLLPLSLYFLVLFLYRIAPTFDQELTTVQADYLIAALKYFGGALLVLICGVFLFLSAFSFLSQRIRRGLRPGLSGYARLRLESALLQSRMGIFLNIGLLLTLPVPLLLVQMDRFLHPRWSVNLPALFHLLTLLILVTSVWGLHSCRHLLSREKSLYDGFPE
ncbi:MAG: hypothetical protein ACR2L2_15855 [Acidobacteriota bacterium]